MNQLKNVLRALLFANLVSFGTAGAVLVTDLRGQLPLQTAVSLFLFSFVTGTTIALFCLLFGYLFNVRERLLLGTLISLALAATNILNANFANESLLPLAIYAIALANGLLVGAVTTAVSTKFMQN